jgi:murein tripeptide amidase MpaA
VLYLAWYFSNKYGQEPAVTRLLDTRVLYLRPKFNPDGADYCLTHPDSLRSTCGRGTTTATGRPTRIPPKTSDGDGAITQMRVKSAERDPQDSRATTRG